MKSSLLSMYNMNILYDCKEPDFKGNVSIITGEDTEDTEKDSREKYICRLCSNYITEGSLKYFIDGACEHFFTNPAGKFFHVRTFADAPGCMRWGDCTEEFSWFQGYLWNYALCSLCNNHLGWHYLKGQVAMFGLIAEELKQVIEGDEK